MKTLCKLRKINYWGLKKNINFDSLKELFNSKDPDNVILGCYIWSGLDELSKDIFYRVHIGEFPVDFFIFEDCVWKSSKIIAREYFFNCINTVLTSNSPKERVHPFIHDYYKWDWDDFYTPPDDDWEYYDLLYYDHTWIKEPDLLWDLEDLLMGW